MSQKNTNNLKERTANEQLEQACNSQEELIAYLHEKARNHRHYKRYTKSERLKSWIDAKALFLDNGVSWTDSDDKERLNPKGAQEVNFCACFTFSESENVAMWMLYGGMKKEGVMIDFYGKEIRELLQTKEVDFGYWGDTGFCSVLTLQAEEVKIELADILYCGDSNNGVCSIKRSDARFDKFPHKDINNMGWRQKAYPWFFENECRIVISVDKGKIKDSRITTARIKTEQLYTRAIENKRIYHAPNSRPTEYQASVLYGHMEWDLCKGACPRKE